MFISLLMGVSLVGEGMKSFAKRMGLEFKTWVGQLALWREKQFCLD